MKVLSFLVNIYMIILTVRIILTWFSGFGTGGLQEALARITDPYLDWFRRFTFLRIGALDLSPIAALGVLSLFNRVFSTLAFYGHITVGVILAITLLTAWSAVSFFLGFLIIILVLRLIAYMLNQNTFSSFWRIIDTISQPVLYRINRFFFRGRIVNYLSGIILSVASLAAAYVVLGFIVSRLAGVLSRLPF
jgi:YggT family protein